MRRTSTRSRVPHLAGAPAGALAVLLTVGLVAAEASADVSAVDIIEDPFAFAASSDVVAVPFPADADVALPARPFRGLSGHSCIDGGTGIDLDGVTVTGATRWLCFLDGDWTAGPDNIDPAPTGATIVADGEDDFVLTLDQPVHRIGIGLLTNRFGDERITLVGVDGTTTVLEGPELGTAPNAREFVGVVSGDPVAAVTVDTAGGSSQNAGITDLFLGHTPPSVPVAIDIRPGDPHNCMNPRVGALPVAVLSGDGFDARTVDPGTVALEGVPARAVGRHGRVGTMADVDGDGDQDLLVHVRDASPLVGKDEARLTGATVDGVAIEGRDHVCSVGKPPGWRGRADHR